MYSWKKRIYTSFYIYTHLATGDTCGDKYLRKFKTVRVTNAVCVESLSHKKSHVDQTEVCRGFYSVFQEVFIKQQSAGQFNEVKWSLEINGDASF